MRYKLTQSDLVQAIFFWMRRELDLPNDKDFTADVYFSADSLRPDGDQFSVEVANLRERKR